MNTRKSIITLTTAVFLLLNMAPDCKACTTDFFNSQPPHEIQFYSDTTTNTCNADSIAEYTSALITKLKQTAPPEFTDQLNNLIVGTDSMFYIKKTEIISPKRGVFRKAYPQTTMLPIEPEKVLKEDMPKLIYLQKHYKSNPKVTLQQNN